MTIPAFALALALAGVATADCATPFGGAPPAPAAQLDALRGGFTTAGGVQVALGIDRVVSINGDVVAQTNITLADVGAAAAGDFAAAGMVLSGTDVVQNVIQTGAGNVMLAPLSAQAAGAMVIQNSLNGQRIQSQTTVNAAVNSLDVLKSLNFQGSLGDALAHAVASR